MNRRHRKKKFFIGNWKPRVIQLCNVEMSVDHKISCTESQIPLASRTVEIHVSQPFSSLSGVYYCTLLSVDEPFSQNGLLALCLPKRIFQSAVKILTSSAAPAFLIACRRKVILDGPGMLS